MSNRVQTRYQRSCIAFFKIAIPLFNLNMTSSSDFERSFNLITVAVVRNYPVRAGFSGRQSAPVIII